MANGPMYPIDRGELIEWLQTLDPETPLQQQVKRCGGQCPLEVFVKVLGMKLDVGFFGLFDTDGNRVYDNPEWVKTFIAEVDSQRSVLAGPTWSNSQWKLATAGRCLELLAS